MALPGFFKDALYSVNEDDFVRNLVTYRCEARLGLLSFQPKAAIYGSAS